MWRKNAAHRAPTRLIRRERCQSKIAEWSYSLGFISAVVDLSTGSWTTQNVVGYPREDAEGSWCCLRLVLQNFRRRRSLLLIIQKRLQGDVDQRVGGPSKRISAKPTYSKTSGPRRGEFVRGAQTSDSFSSTQSLRHFTFMRRDFDPRLARDAPESVVCLPAKE